MYDYKMYLFTAMVAFILINAIQDELSDMRNDENVSETKGNIRTTTMTAGEFENRIMKRLFRTVVFLFIGFAMVEGLIALTD